MDNIKISCGKGEEELSDYDKEIIDRLTKEYKSKLERHFDTITSFDLRVKCHSKQGNIKRFEISALLIVPGHRFEATSDEYKISEAVHKALERLMIEIEHKLKVSDQGNKARDRQKTNIRKR